MTALLVIKEHHFSQSDFSDKPRAQITYLGTVSRSLGCITECARLPAYDQKAVQRPLPHFSDILTAFIAWAACPETTGSNALSLIAQQADFSALTVRGGSVRSHA